MNGAKKTLMDNEVFFRSCGGLWCRSTTLAGRPAAGGHGFDGQNSEIFLSRKDKGTAAGKMIAQNRKRLVAKEFYIGSRYALQFLALWTFSNHDEPLSRLRKSSNGKIHSLVGYELSRAQIEVANLLRYLKVVHCDRWVDNRSLTIVNTADAVCDML